jgi:hypothetical protein
MSFRVEGETFDQWVEKVASDLRYLYKCCERGGGGLIEVDASSEDTGWPSDGRSEAWSPEAPGSAQLFEVFASVILTPATVDATIEVHHSTLGIVATLVIPAGSNSASVAVTPNVLYNAGETLWITTGGAGGRALTVQCLMEGTNGRGSAGLNIHGEGGGGGEG